jgi:uncharacterized damage-inducible protein DinB
LSLGPIYAKELESGLAMFRRTLSVFDGADARFAPLSGLFSVAGHVAHAADTVDWFMEGAFGDGWSLDFDAHIARAHAVTALHEAVAWLDRAYEDAARRIAAASDEELEAAIPDRRILNGAPRKAVVSAITDHTAHHRGSLAVYARLLGKVPVMPYA